MSWHIEDPQGNEAEKIRHMIVPYTRGQGLDLGCGPWKAWPHFISVDDFDEWQGAIDSDTGRPWHPDIIGNATDLKMFADNSLDFVFSSHLLEHIEDTEATLRETLCPEGIGHVSPTRDKLPDQTETAEPHKTNPTRVSRTTQPTTLNHRNAISV